MKATPFPQVNTVLADLLHGARAILSEEFVGLYLYGSLAYGGFDPNRSDIDFVIVTRDELRSSTIAELETLHERFATSDSKWAQKLEGQYVPLKNLRRFDAHGPQLPTINEKVFSMAGQGSDWIIQRYVLREYDSAVAGPSLRDYIDPVSPQDIRSAALHVLDEWWVPMLDDPAWLVDRPDYQAFAVQTMCRILYAAEFGAPGTKTEAAAWCIETLDEPWKSLIDEAINWTPEQPPVGVKRAVDLLRYTVELCRAGT